MISLLLFRNSFPISIVEINHFQVTLQDVAIKYSSGFVIVQYPQNWFGLVWDVNSNIQK